MQNLRITPAMGYAAQLFFSAAASGNQVRHAQSAEYAFRMPHPARCVCNVGIATVEKYASPKIQSKAIRILGQLIYILCRYDAADTKPGPPRRRSVMSRIVRPEIRIYYPQCQKRMQRCRYRRTPVFIARLDTATPDGNERKMRRYALRLFQVVGRKNIVVVH